MFNWCWHKWTKWTEPIAGAELVGQHRKCRKCNVAQYRLVRIT